MIRFAVSCLFWISFWLLCGAIVYAGINWFTEYTVSFENALWFGFGIRILFSLNKLYDYICKDLDV